MPSARSFAVTLVVLLLAPATASALPSPGMNGEAWEPVFGRLFPEALQTNDYISYSEALASLELLNARHSDMMEIVDVGESVGWTNLVSQQKEPSRVVSVELTNELSVVPADEKLNLVFLIAVHGNEKGAREGALRVIEDFLVGAGVAAKQPELVDLLDEQRLVFVFANSDGWTHEELEYRANDACYLSVTCTPGEPGVESQNFVRVNGNGIDLNRQYPTEGFLAGGASYRTMEQPEIHATVQYVKSLPGTIGAAADVHGMMNNDNFFRILLKDGQKSQSDFFEQERLAESTKQRLNSNPHYDLYQEGPVVDGAWGSDFAEWAATFDAIGYSASGTGGAWVTQHLGLGAPGFTIEQAYSHITVDNYYPGVGAQMNDFHVESMRDTVAAFMEFVRDRHSVHVAGAGLDVAWLSTDFVATNADDDPSTYEGWFVESDRDDEYDILHRTFEASPNEYFESLGSALENGRVERFDDADALAARAADFDAVVVAGSAAKKLAGNADAVAALKAYAEAGGNLVLTDEALALLVEMGALPSGSVQSRDAYSGYTDLLTRDHYLVDDLKGMPRVTYDANPLGFAAGDCPVWFVDARAWHAAGGDAVGAIALDPSPPFPLADDDHATFHSDLEEGLTSHDGFGVAEVRVDEAREGVGVNVGVLPLGEGRVHVFGALLPDPTEENPHPYGLDGYAVTITGNRIMLAMVGFEIAGEDAASASDADAVAGEAPIPAAGFAGAAFAAVAAAAIGVALRRRH